MRGCPHVEQKRPVFFAARGLLLVLEGCDGMIIGAECAGVGELVSGSDRIPLWYEHKGEGVLFATALHSGHLLRPELLSRSALDEATRLREEDPCTEQWATVAPNWLIPLRSRFEVDLNRARNEAVYLEPKDAWNLKLWKSPPTRPMIEYSLEEYDAFYRELEVFLSEMERRYGHFVVYDLHAYNHRRQGPEHPPADPATHPDINLGTGTMNRKRWAPLVERFLRDVACYDFPGRRLTVGENVVFRGRQFPRWVHSRFPETGCVLSIEVKKFYMDEWTGKVDPFLLRAVHDVIASTVPGVIEELEKL